MKTVRCIVHPIQLRGRKKHRLLGKNFNTTSNVSAYGGIICKSNDGEAFFLLHEFVENECIRQPLSIIPRENLPIQRGLLWLRPKTLLMNSLSILDPVGSSAVNLKHGKKL